MYSDMSRRAEAKRIDDELARVVEEALAAGEPITVGCIWLDEEKRLIPCVEGECHDCGDKIVWSKRVPTEGTTRVCIPCIKERLEGGRA